jgi:hypothetical protein
VRLLDAVVEAAIPDYPPLAANDTAAVRAHVLAFATQHFRAAPLQVRLAATVLLGLFAAYCWVSKGKSLTALTAAERSAALSEFSRRTPPLFSGLERLVRSVSVLAYFEHPSVLASSGYETIEDRQRARRHLRTLAE